MFGPNVINITNEGDPLTRYAWFPKKGDPHGLTEKCRGGSSCGKKQ